MSAYNIIHADIVCPRCDAPVGIAAECKLGYTSQMQDLYIGDRYPFLAGWGPERSFAADAYDECSECGFDFGVRVDLEYGVIRAVRGEPMTIPNIHDGTLYAAVVCQDCDAAGEKEIRLYNGATPGDYRLGDCYLAGARVAAATGWVRGLAYCGADCTWCRPVKVFLHGSVLVSVAIDENRSPIAAGLY